MIVETAVVPKITSHRFPIQNGRVRETMKEFMAFKERYYSCWGSITVILRRMEEMLVNFNVPIAFVDGDKLAQVRNHGPWGTNFDIVRGADCAQLKIPEGAAALYLKS